MIRIYADETDFEMAVEALDGANIPFDLDAGDRIMVEDGYAREAIDVLEEEGVDFEEG